MDEERETPCCVVTYCQAVDWVDMDNSIETYGVGRETGDRLAPSVGSRLSRLTEAYCGLTAHRFLSNFPFENIDLSTIEGLFHD